MWLWPGASELARVPARFVPRNGLQLHLRSWGDEYAVLDEASGDTHLVGHELINALCRFYPLLASHPAIQGSPPAETLEARALDDESVLHNLLRMGLIEPAER